MVRFARYSLLAVTLALLACSDSSGSTPTELPNDVIATVGAKGGKLEAAGVTLDIPEGALSKNVKVSATNVGKSAPEELRTRQVSDTYEFGPEGTKFDKDVTVSFPNKEMNERVEVYFTKEGSREFEVIKSERRGDQVVAKVRHFSQGFLGVPLADDEPDARDDAGELTPDPEPLDAGAEDTPPEDGGVDMDAGPAVDASAVVRDAGAVDASTPEAALPTTRITVRSRDLYGALVNQTWAAYQDGAGAWRALPAPTQTGVYEFDVVSNVFAVALVCSSSDQTNSWGTLHYASTASTMLELGTPGSVCTTGTPPVKHSLSGIVRLQSGYWYWRYGHAHQYSPVNSTGGSTTTPGFTLTELVNDEPNDVLFTSAPGTSSWMIGKVDIRRDVRPTASVDAGFDFDLVDGGVAPSGNPTVEMLGATGDAGTIDVHYLTRATEIGLWLNTSATSGFGTRTATFATLPESIRRSTDLYFARGAEESPTQWRRASIATYPSGPLTFTLPASFGVGFGAVRTPYVRPTFDFAQVANAREYLFNLDYSPTANSHHRFDIELDPTWISGTGQVMLTFPDFSPLSGFNSSWVAPSSANVSAKATVQTYSFDGTTTLKSESGQATTLTPPL